MFDFDYLLAAFWLTALLVFVAPMAIMERRKYGYIRKIKKV